MAAESAAAESVMKLADWQQLLLAFASIGACLLCLYFVFIFGRRLALSAQMRGYLVDSAFRQTYDALLRDLKDKALRGPLDQQAGPPIEFGETRQLWEDNYYPKYRDRLGPNQPGEEEPSAEKTAKMAAALKKCEDWEKAERDRFEKNRREIELEAHVRAEGMIPEVVDASLLGGGSAFLLEFSTVIVIIFTLLVLGVVGQVDGKSAVTILASIAGYVLGKASSGSGKDSSKTQEQGLSLGKPRKP